MQEFLRVFLCLRSVRFQGLTSVRRFLLIYSGTQDLVGITLSTGDSQLNIP